jgi:hypothetical protein
MLYLLRLLVRWSDDAEAGCHAQAELLRDVFGNPFPGSKAGRAWRST